MFAIALNPGFVLLIGALVVLAAPARLRAPAMILSALGALALLLAPDYGRYGAFAQIGLTMAPLALDALNYLFGLAFIGLAVLVAIYAGGREHRLEDAALMLLAGAATAALFVGDLVSFVAAAELAGLAAAWIVFCAPGKAAAAAGVRLLIWQGLEGLLLLAGVAFLLSDGLRSDFGAMDARTIGGALFLGGLAIRVGAPLAHVWLKDVAANASPVGAAAIALYPALLGVYALSRAFPGELALVYVAAGMMAIGALGACAADDLRAAAAYSLTAQLGLALAAIGLGAPMAIAAGAAHAFAITFAYALLFMALGLFVRRAGSASAAALAGAGPIAPVSAALLAIGCLAAGLAPGFAPYLSVALAQQAGQGLPWLAWAMAATIALGAVHTGVRPWRALFAEPAHGRPALRRAPVFSMLLAAALAAFLSLAVGLAPGWLYTLAPPAGVAFAPFAPAVLAPHLSLVATAAAAWLLLRALGLAPRERSLRLLDVDALYQGPLAGAGRWTGVMLLRLYGVWQALSAAAGRKLAAALEGFARAGDRPYQSAWLAPAGLCALAALLLVVSAARP